MYDSEDASSDTSEPRRKKGKVTKHKHAKEIMKRARSKGEEFVTNTGLLVEVKKTGKDCACRNKCMEHFSPDEKETIIKTLYNGRPKNEKDVYLMGLIERHEVARHRPVNESSKQTAYSYTYFAMKNNNRVKVCRTAFISLHASSNHAVSRLTSLLGSNITPEDGRGKHVNRGNVLPAVVNAMISDHVKCFPTYVSHYTSKPVTYLDAELTVSKMHMLFLEKHPHLKGTVKYEYYLKYFNENFGYRFGRPQVDVCPSCEDLNSKLKSSVLNDNAKRTAAAELMVHKRRAKKFYTKLKSVTELSKSDPKVGGVVFDFMQNLPLPAMPVQDIFYLRKLWYFVFNAQDLKTGQSVFYNYPEGEALKGPNEVCSFLHDFIENYVPKEVEILHIFSDACAGQNRNHTLIRFLLTLTMNKRFKEIHEYFPVRGHSFMPCDRTFGLIKRVIRKHDRIYVPDQYKELICKSKAKQPTFLVTDVCNEDIINFKSWWPVHFKKTTQSKPFGTPPTKVPFSISKFKQIVYRKGDRFIECHEFIDSFVKYKFKLNKNENVPFPHERAYTTKIPIKRKKIEDVVKIMKYIPQEYMPFYEELKTWPTTDAEAADDGE